METLRKSRGLVALVLLVAASGCRQVENPGKVFPQSPTVEDTRSKEIQIDQLPDIPVPRDMTYITRGNQSFSYAQGGVRVGRFHYWGNVPIDEVVAFYRERMPQKPYGWTLVNEQSQGGMTTMQFQKTSDHLEVRIGPEGSSTISVVSLNTQSR
jgi:hypothetical protein